VEGFVPWCFRQKRHGADSHHGEEVLESNGKSPDDFPGQVLDGSIVEPVGDDGTELEAVSKSRIEVSAMGALTMTTDSWTATIRPLR
jgi:hypothetical protein